jgi:uncharacterized repeat protein (TIGR01451 family)
MELHAAVGRRQSDIHLHERRASHRAPSNFTVVVHAEKDILGVNDGTVSERSSASTAPATTRTRRTTTRPRHAYVTPDADMAVTVSDSPDPVFPDGNITYTVQVTNNGPDTATSASLNSFNNGTLKFQSLTVPSRDGTARPSVGAAPTFNCTNPSFANGCQLDLHRSSCKRTTQSSASTTARSRRPSAAAAASPIQTTRTTARRKTPPTSRPDANMASLGQRLARPRFAGRQHHVHRAGHERWPRHRAERDAEPLQQRLAADSSQSPRPPDGTARLQPWARRRHSPAPIRASPRRQRLFTSSCKPTTRSSASTTARSRRPSASEAAPPIRNQRTTARPKTRPTSRPTRNMASPSPTRPTLCSRTATSPTPCR